MAVLMHGGYRSHKGPPLNLVHVIVIQMNLAFEVQIIDIYAVSSCVRSKTIFSRTMLETV